MTPSALIALVSGFGAVIVWTLATARMFLTPHAQRPTGVLAMYITALIASIAGALASLGHWVLGLF